MTDDNMTDEELAFALREVERLGLVEIAWATTARSITGALVRS
jgi:hypothetical protein